MAHVVWDWNGTLFDDLHIIVEAVSRCMDEFGAAPITVDVYRAHYTRPVKVFYDRLLGRDVVEEEWRRLDDLFHDAYRELLPAAGPAADAGRAVQAVTAAGATQSLLSMFPHDELLPLVRRHRLDGSMVRIDGLRGPPGGQKQGYLEAHLAELDVPGPNEVLLIGDALDDAEAARGVGAACVLYASGSHELDVLERTGYPVATSLLQALELGGIV